MKHSFQITVVILGLFLIAQLLGIAIVYKYIDQEKTGAEGKTTFKDLPIGERPPLEEKTSYITIILAILLGTAMLLFLIKFNLLWLWKMWFFLALFIALTVAFNVFFPTIIAFSVALLLSLWKIIRPNIIVQNVTEVFVYGGLAAIFVPLFNLWSISILLILIALYDIYAVWKSKHMVTLAKAQTKAKMFAGLMIPYTSGKIVSEKISKGKTKITQKVRTALLGGGDIGFPLLFAGVVLKEIGLWQSLVIPFFAMLGLGFLLWYGDQNKFYPAMPFIGAGCFVGLGLVWIVSLM